MNSFRAHRLIAGEIDAVRALCAQLTAERGSLWAARREPLDPAAWMARRLPVSVVSEGGRVLGFAAALPDGQAYSAPRCAELVVGVASSHLRRGIGRASLAELLMTARTMGLWKLVAFAFPEDVATRSLLLGSDFREVGALDKHVQLDGVWRGVAVYERLLMTARKSLPSV
jgi:L-amino acid N-acyltransferase YncA